MTDKQQSWHKDFIDAIRAIYGLGPLYNKRDLTVKETMLSRNIGDGNRQIPKSGAQG